jgi:hemoglobin/transferrin/lactoferrin receptor protein
VRLRGGYESNNDGLFGTAIAAGKPTENLDLLGVYTRREAGNYKSGDGTKVVPSNVTSESYLLKGRYYIDGDQGHNLWASYENWQSDSNQVYDQAEAFATTTVRRKVDDTTAVFGYENDFGGSKLFDIEAQASYANSEVQQRETTFLPGVVYSEFSYKTWQGRLQNTSRFDWGPDWTGFLFVGGQFYTQERRNPRVTTTGTTTPGAATHPEGDMEKYGLYAQAELIWSDKLTIIPGVRVDWTKLKPGAGVTTSEKVDDSAVSPKIAALYSFNDNFAVFGSIARTVRMPVLDEIYSRTNATATNFSLNLKPEESDNFEGGFTLSFDGVLLQGDAVRAKVTAFRNDVDNLIARGTANSAYFINVGKSRFEGVEVEAEYASRGVFARLGYSTIDGEKPPDRPAAQHHPGRRTGRHPRLPLHRPRPFGRLAGRVRRRPGGPRPRRTTHRRLRRPQPLRHLDAPGRRLPRAGGPGRRGQPLRQAVPASPRLPRRRGPHLQALPGPDLLG